MSKRCRYSAEQKFGILQEYSEGMLSKEQLCSKYDINLSTFDAWRHKYTCHGNEGLNRANVQKEYPLALRLQAIQECIDDGDSVRAVARKYGISTHSVLLKWIKQYNGYKEPGRVRKGRSQSMTKGRSTTWKERIEITEYCIAHNKDYQKTIEAFSVSYQQIYSWVRKYEKGGINGLKDGRGRTKDESELTPLERQNLAMKRLEAENQRLKAENAFLKKLEELERRRS